MSRNKNIFEITIDSTINRNLICDGDSVVAGVSGGPDSMFLLHLLVALKQKLEFKLYVAHVNHGIREEAVEDENLVKAYCENNEIPFYVLHADVLKLAQNEKISTELCGRNVRYNFFKEIMKKTGSKKLAVAHNMGDNVETVLLNILRGTGIEGLAAMQYEIYSKVIEGIIIRPILDLKKADIVRYLDDDNVPYAIDKTNLSCDYTRNKIRNVLIPYLEKEYNPNILETLNRTAYLASQDEQIINEYVNQKYNSLNIKRFENCEIIIPADEVNNNTVPVRYRLIRKILEDLLGNIQGIELIHIHDICELIQKCITGKKYIIGNKFEVEVLKKRKIKFRRTLLRKE